MENVTIQNREDLKFLLINELHFSPILAEKTSQGKFKDSKINEVWVVLKKCYNHFCNLVFNVAIQDVEASTNFFKLLKGDFESKKKACIEAGVEEKVLENRCCLHMLWVLVQHLATTYPEAIHLPYDKAIPATAGESKIWREDYIDGIAKKVSKLNRDEKFALIVKILAEAL